MLISCPTVVDVRATVLRAYVAVSSATAWATSARSTRRREHSTAAARALSNARSLLAVAHPKRFTTETVVNESTFAKSWSSSWLG